MRCGERSPSLQTIAGGLDQELKRRRYVGQGVERAKDKALGESFNPVKMQPRAYSMSL